MSKLVDTKLGTYNCVSDGRSLRWLYRCNACSEWLPLTEDHMQGREPIDHQSLVYPGRYCSVAGTFDFGIDLLSVVQSRILCGFKPFRSEIEPPMYIGSDNLEEAQEAANG